MAPSDFIADEEHRPAELDYQSLYNGLQVESMPKHVALFMDGPIHAELKEITQICCKLGIKVLTVYTHSSENFHSPKLEKVDAAWNIAKLDLEDLTRNDIRISVIGKKEAFSDSLIESIREVEETTKNNKSLHVIEVVDYTGRRDITQACIALAEKVEQGLIQPEDIDETVFEQELETKCSEFPNPDLMIRTSGKHGIDNFMLWQMAYGELYFVENKDVEFNKIEFLVALDEYQKRSRRCGK